MKIVRFIRRVSPSVDTGFPDYAFIIGEDNKFSYRTQKARTTPNAFKPKTNEPWDKVYGCVALGDYHGQVIQHDKYGKCILIEEGKELPAILPNVNHDNRSVVAEMFVHSGYSDTWPGSAACITIRKCDWNVFIALFSIGEKVLIQIVGS